MNGLTYTLKIIFYDTKNKTAQKCGTDVEKFFKIKFHNGARFFADYENLKYQIIIKL